MLDHLFADPHLAAVYDAWHPRSVVLAPLRAGSLRVDQVRSGSD